MALFISRKTINHQSFLPPFFLSTSSADDYAFVNARVVVRLSNDPRATGTQRAQITAQMPIEGAFD